MPTSFAGYRLKWASDRSALTLTMEQKVVEAARSYMPELLDGTVKKSELLSGVALEKAADALMLNPSYLHLDSPTLGN